MDAFSTAVSNLVTYLYAATNPVMPIPIAVIAGNADKIEIPRPLKAVPRPSALASPDSKPSVAAFNTVTPSADASATLPTFSRSEATLDTLFDASPTFSKSFAVSEAALLALDNGFSKSSENFDSPNNFFARSLFIFLFLKNLLTSIISSKSFIVDNKSFFVLFFRFPLKDFLIKSGISFIPVSSKDFPIFLYSSVV